MEKKQSNKGKYGITLIALVITIIVLLILAGISISMLSGNNGILKRAGDARDDTVVGQEKEQVELAYISAVVKKLGDNVEKDDLQDELDISVGDEKTLVTGTSTINVHFYDTKHNFTVNNGNVTRIANGEPSAYNNDTILDDLEKLRRYFIGTTYDDVWDSDTDTYKNNDILSDASSINWADYGTAQNYCYEVIEYKSNKYKLTESYDEHEVLQVDELEIKDIDEIAFDFNCNNYVNEQSLKIDAHEILGLKNISNLFEMEEIEIISNNENILTITKGYFGDENDWTFSGKGHNGQTTLTITGKSSNKTIDINITI